MLECLRQTLRLGRIHEFFEPRNLLRMSQDSNPLMDPVYTHFLYAAAFPSTYVMASAPLEIAYLLIRRILAGR